MPFITEEIWQFLPGNEGTFLIGDKWPVFDESKVYAAESEVVEKAMEIIKAVRDIRVEAEASPGRKLTAVVLADEDKKDLFSAGTRYICDIGNITELKVTTDKADIPAESMSGVVAGAEIYVPLDELVDFEAELERLTKEKKKLEGEVKRVKGMLSNEGFVKKAPAAKVQEEKDKMAKYEDMLAKVTDRLAVIENKLK